MKKIIRQIGSSVGIIFNKEEQQIYDLKVGKTIDLEIEQRLKELKEKRKGTGKYNGVF